MNEAYVNKVYGDGDKDIHFPFWRQVLQKELTNFETKSLEREQERVLFIDKDEIALKHPQNGATVKLRNDGSIELFVNEDTGMRFDSKENSITFYGDSVHFATKEMRMHTKPQGLIWNNHNFNPYLYYGEKVGEERHIPKMNGSINGQNMELSLFQEQERKQYYDEKVTAIIEGLGLESSRIKRGG